MAQAASGSDPVAAELLFQSGIELLKAGRWSEACAKFQKSMVLDPSVSTSIKIARCHEHEGRVASAWYEYQLAIKLAHDRPAPEPRQSRLLEIIGRESSALVARLPRLRVRVQPASPGLVVSRDGQTLAPEVLGEALPVDPGEHEISASASGYRIVTRQIRSIEGHTSDVDLVLEPAGEAEPLLTRPMGPSPATTEPAAVSDTPKHHAEHSPPTAASTPDHWGGRDTGIVVGSVGLAALGSAGYFTYRVLAQVRESNKFCDGALCQAKGDELRDYARRDQTIGIVCASLGAAALGAGIVLYATAPRETTSAEPVGRDVSVILSAGGITATANW